MAENCTWIHGIGSSEAIDTAGEIVSLAGIDCSSLIGGAFNWEHKSDIPAQTVGKVLEYKKIFSEEDCENEYHKYFWDKCKTPYLYVMGRLLDDKKPSAVECAALFKDDAEHPDEQPMVGLSIEGSKVDKQGLIVTKSIARKITITGAPANKTCVAEMVPAEAAKADPDSIFKSEPSFCIELMEKREEPLKATIAGGTPASERPHGKVQYNVRKPTKHWAKPQSESKKFFKQKNKIQNRESNFAQGGSGSSSAAHKQSSNPETPTFTHDRRIEAIPHRSMRKAEGMNKPQWSAGKKQGNALHFSHPEHGVVSIHKQPEGGFHVKHQGKLAGLGNVKGNFASAAEAGKHAKKYMGAISSRKTLSPQMHDRSSPQMPSMSKAEEQKYHIHVKGQRITQSPLSISEIKQHHGKNPQDLERNPDVKVVPHHPAMKKGMSAGSGMASPGSLSGGAVLAPESMDKKMKKNVYEQKGVHKPPINDLKGGTSVMGTHIRKPSDEGSGSKEMARRHAQSNLKELKAMPKPKLDKSEKLLRAEKEYSAWTKREEFEAFMAKSMPHLAKGEIAAIGQALILSKSMKAEKKLAKMMTGSPLNSFVEKKEKK